MISKISAGVLVYRRKNKATEVLLVHPGGPYFRNKQEGAWTLPKGEPDLAGIDDPDHLSVAEATALRETAFRELKEETGIALGDEEAQSLGFIRQKGGKMVFAWAVEFDFEGEIVSNTFEMEWPPRSGRLEVFPEVDEGRYFGLDEARQMINIRQVPFLDRLEASLTPQG